MAFMRLGTRTAIINEAGEILLAKRADFGIWALPGGRVDTGELLHESAIREVREETGLEVEIERAIGLYYQQGRSRMNVLYRAKVIGGELFSKTDETLDNQFFALDNLPDEIFGKFYIDHAYTDTTHIYTQKTSQWELIKLDLKLRWRWVQNLIAGKPEPKFPHFDIRAVGIIRHGDEVFAPDYELPCIVSDGKLALDAALSQQIPAIIRSKLNWQWVGLYQNPQTVTLEFIFESQADAQSEFWTSPEKLGNQHQRYTQMETMMDNVWLMQGDK